LLWNEGSRITNRVHSTRLDRSTVLTCTDYLSLATSTYCLGFSNIILLWRRVVVGMNGAVTSVAYNGSRISKGINSILRVFRTREVVIGNVLIVIIEGVVGTLNDRLEKIDNLMVDKVRIHGLKLVLGRSKVRFLIDKVGVSILVVLRTFHEL